MASGVIYAIVNSGTGKYYLGSTTDFRKRIRDHFRMLRAGNHHSIHLQNSWNRWGEDYFFPTVLYESADLHVDEQRELDHMISTNWDRTYNVSPRAGGGDLVSCHPERDKIRKKNLESRKKFLAGLSEEDKREKWGKAGASNSNWKGGVSKYTNVCPECGGSKGATSLICLDCKEATGWMPSSDKVEIEVYGVRYESYNHASRELGVAPSTIKDRCKSFKPKFDNWRICSYAEVSEPSRGGTD